MYSQPWSAWPRSFQARFVIFRLLVLVDIARVSCGVDFVREVSVLRRVGKSATVIAARAARTARVLKGVDVVVVVVEVDAVVEGGLEDMKLRVGKEGRKRLLILVLTSVTLAG